MTMLVACPIEIVSSLFVSTGGMEERQGPVLAVLNSVGNKSLETEVLPQHHSLSSSRATR
jgi:hypothetical protein